MAAHVYLLTAKIARFILITHSLFLAFSVASSSCHTHHSKKHSASLLQSTKNKHILFCEEEYTLSLTDGYIKSIKQHKLTVKGIQCHKLAEIKRITG